MEFEHATNQRRRSASSSIYHRLYSVTGFCSRQSLARDLGLSLPTVYQNLSKLMEAGLVRDSGEQQATGGRKASGLSIVPGARMAVGISIMERQLRFVAADLQLNELAYRKTDIEPIGRFSDMGELLSQQLEHFLDKFSIDRGRLLGVGIALPAVMSSDSRYITAAPTLSLKDTTLEGLTAHIPYPTYVENDATCGGFAEWFARSTQKTMAYLSLETGVGGAVLFNGVPYPGENHRSAEFGHMCIEPGGLLCSCGKRGCLEAYCSTRRIRDTFGVSVEEFFHDLEHNGDYKALWNNMLRYLALGVNNIHLALDCDVVLGGWLSEYIPPYFSQLKEYAASGNPFGCDSGFLHLSTRRRHIVPLGAALHFIVRFLEQL